jgi:CheY-like chemotaxis protein
MASPRILITNHDPAYLDMMRELLIEEGYPHVFCVPSSDAFATIKREQI